MKLLLLVKIKNNIILRPFVALRYIFNGSDFESELLIIRVVHIFRDKFSTIVSHESSSKYEAVGAFDISVVLVKIAPPMTWRV